ncbi:MAG: T9SS type A sorting domain-containing protein [Bacteroidales bacterium]|nr:T9SS type A sorting domain-containing protein [Bacteroidales bacterium]
MIKSVSFLLFFLFSFVINYAQYPPPAGQEGTTAIHKDSSAFVGWAVGCAVERGFMDISNPELGQVSAGDETLAIGQADGQIISLGDGGVALLHFDQPLRDGTGPDFAVFENGLSDDFLELAFVEVSSDGVNFFRFDAISLTQTNTQVGTFGLLDATKLHYLAGKYRLEYGFPFDIEHIEDNPLLDKDSIVQVRIIDVVGCIQDEYTTYDSQGNKINDPWPTPFESGGFDLDAVGVIHDASTSYVNENIISETMVYPNPARNYIYIEFTGEVNISDIELYNDFGNLVEISTSDIQDQGQGIFIFNISFISSGLYLIRLRSGDHFFSEKFLKL